MATNNKRNTGNGNNNNASKGKGKRRIIVAATPNNGTGTVYLPAVAAPIVIKPIKPVAPATPTPNTGNGNNAAANNTVHAAVLQAMQALGIKAPVQPTPNKAAKAAAAATPTPQGAALLNYALVQANNAQALALFTQHIWQGIASGQNTTCKLYNYLRDQLGWRRLPGSVAFRAFVQGAGIATFTVAQHGKRTLTTVSLPTGNTGNTGNGNA